MRLVGLLILLAVVFSFVVIWLELMVKLCGRFDKAIKQAFGISQDKKEASK